MSSRSSTKNKDNVMQSFCINMAGLELYRKINIDERIEKRKCITFFSHRWTMATGETRTFVLLLQSRFNPHINTHNSAFQGLVQETRHVRCHHYISCFCTAHCGGLADLAMKEKCSKAKND